MSRTGAEYALDMLEGVIRANLPALSSPDRRVRRCAMACIRASAMDYADLRRTETLPDDVRAAAEYALRLADSAPGAPSKDQAAFRRYVLDQAAQAYLSAALTGRRKGNHDEEGLADCA